MELQLFTHTDYIAFSGAEGDNPLFEQAMQLLLNARIKDAYQWGDYVRFTLHGIPFCMRPVDIIEIWGSK